LIPYGRQLIDNTDIESVLQTLQSDWLTQGPAVELFERTLAEYCGVRYAVAVSNATAALHLAAMALGAAPGRKIWTSPISFVASANCALYCGATPGFVDIESATRNMDPEALSRKLNQEGNPHIVIPVHFAGHPCDMERIASLSRMRGFRVIEDASHAIGSMYQQEKIGSCSYSDITVFSFHPVKIITSGEGGMALTNDLNLSNRMRLLRSHGITRDPLSMENESHGSWYYEQTDLGYNYRLTDIQSALGISQMKRIDRFIERRRELFIRYSTHLENLPIELPREAAYAHSSWHLYAIKVKPEIRKQLFDFLRAREIGVNVHYIPIHLQPYYQRLGFRNGDFPESERYYAGAVSLPLHAGLTDDEQDTVIDSIHKFFNK